MSIGGFFVLLGIAVLLRLIGNRLVPLLMPAGLLRTVAVGWIGGFLGSLLDSSRWQFGPEVASIYLVAAVTGCALFILFLGLVPFVRILLGNL